MVVVDPPPVEGGVDDVEPDPPGAVVAVVAVTVVDVVDVVGGGLDVSGTTLGARTVVVVRRGGRVAGGTVWAGT